VRLRDSWNIAVTAMREQDTTPPVIDIITQTDELQVVLREPSCAQRSCTTSGG
jgi:hypothetical protein